jgi:hypothetical protein
VAVQLAAGRVFGDLTSRGGLGLRLTNEAIFRTMRGVSILMALDGHCRGTT